MKYLVALTFILLYGNTECQNINDTLTELNCILLRDALYSSNLIETLEGLDNITLFAPTDEAITAAGDLPEGAALEELLKYHAINNFIQSSAIENELYIVSLNDFGIRFNIYNERVDYTAQGAPLDTNRLDQNVSNGLIHVLNAVMTSPTGTIFEYLDTQPEKFSILVDAINTLNLTDMLNSTSSESWTGFAPTNTAFNNIPSADREELLGNNTYLLDILSYHITNTTHYSADLNNGDQILTSRGDDLAIVVTNDVISLKEENYAKVTTADISVTNGVLHEIDRVLDMPVRLNGSTTVSLQISLLSTCLALAVSALKW